MACSSGVLGGTRLGSDKHSFASRINCAHWSVLNFTTRCANSSVGRCSSIFGTKQNNFHALGLAQKVSRQLGTVSLPQSDNETLSHLAPEEMRATLQHCHPVEQLFLQIYFVQLCPSSKNTVPWWCIGCCQCWLDPWRRLHQKKKLTFLVLLCLPWRPS